jgi:hypothetical protein
MAEGQMRTSVLLGAIASTTPAPISKPFGQQAQWHDNLRMYGGEQLNVSDRAAVLTAQLTAYEWWQLKFVDAARLQSIGLRVSAGGIIVATDASVGSDQTCSICTFPITAEAQQAEPEPEPEQQDSLDHGGGAQAMLLCGHRFHRSCIVTWITEQPSCPNCRAVVPDRYLASLSQPGAGGISTIAETSAALEEEETKWCSEHKLVRTSLRAVQETATATATALQALDLDLLFDERNLKPEAWRAKSSLPRAVIDDGPQSIENLSAVLLNSSEAGAEQDTMAAILNDVLKDSANRVMEQGSLPSPPGLADLVRDKRKLCNFHFAGGCTRGSTCKFRHDLQPGEQPPLCKYFGTPQGCRFGDSCRMAHGNADLAGDAMRDAAQSVAAEQRLADQVGARSVTSGAGATTSKGAYKMRLTGKTILLLGDGDFSFATAIADTAAVLVATSLDSRDDVLAKYGNEDNLNTLAGHPTTHAIHEVDATSLHEVPALHGFIRESADVVCWMFPFTGIEGDNPGNAQLIKRWFISIARVMHYEPSLARYRLLDVRQMQKFEVHVALCGDQFSRWRVEASARNAFLTLSAIEPFDVREFERDYRPLRNGIDEPFELQKPLVYIFTFRPSPLVRAA